jgi:20S proteasome subunit beta 4
LLNRYIEKNLKLYELENDGTKLSTHAQANFCRNELATALRKGPYQVDVLIGGYDTVKKEAQLYFMDHLASLQKVKYNGQGYAAYFCLSIMDRDYIDGLDEAGAMKIMEKCILALRKRFLLSQPNFIIKVVDKDGIRVASVGSDPADT